MYRLEFDINDLTDNILRLPIKEMEILKKDESPGSGEKQKVQKHPGDQEPIDENELTPMKEIDVNHIKITHEMGNDDNKSFRSQSKLYHNQGSLVASNRGLNKLLELEAWPVSEWEEAHKSEFIHIYKRKEEDSPVILIKAYTMLKDIPPEKVFRLIYDLSIRTEWDNILSNMRIFDKVNENIDHMYSLYKAPFGISNRDFCQRRMKSMGYKDTSFIIHFESVEHKDCPEIKGTIRAHTTISGYIIRPDPKHHGSSLMTILTQTDIKGLVPKFIVNAAAAKAPKDWTKNFITNAHKLMKAGLL